MWELPLSGVRAVRGFGFWGQRFSVNRLGPRVKGSRITSISRNSGSTFEDELIDEEQAEQAKLNRRA